MYFLECILYQVREWLRGRASPRQGESRAFDSRFPLQDFPEWIVIQVTMNGLLNKSNGEEVYSGAL